MTKHVTVAPLWPKAAPDPRLDIGKLAHLAPGTTESIIKDMKADQAVRIAELERQFAPTPAVMPKRRRVPVTTTVNGAAAVAVAVTPAVRTLDEVLAAVHPRLAADVVRRSGGDVRRVVVLGPTNVRVLNRPCGE